jgi:hypothetical protein
MVFSKPWQQTTSELLTHEYVYMSRTWTHPMNIRSLLTTPLQPGRPLFVYGMLALILLLLIWNVHQLLSLPPFYPYDRYGNSVVVLMLLFNHLAYQFRWPVPVTVALRLLAIGWLVFGCIYVGYGLLSHPSPPAH